MTDADEVTLPKLTPAQLVAAHEDMSRRVWATVAIITAVARKTRREHLPAGFVPLLRMTRKSIHPYSPKGHIQVRFEVGSTLEFPIELLGKSDRDVATWARERIRACRVNSFHKVKRQLTSDIAATEKRLASVVRELEEQNRRLANLGKPPEPGHRRRA